MHKEALRIWWSNDAWQLRKLLAWIKFPPFPWICSTVTRLAIRPKLRLQPPRHFQIATWRDVVDNVLSGCYTNNFSYDQENGRCWRQVHGAGASKSSKHCIVGEMILMWGQTTWIKTKQASLVHQKTLRIWWSNDAWQLRKLLTWNKFPPFHRDFVNMLVLMTNEGVSQCWGLYVGCGNAKEIRK